MADLQFFQSLVAPVSPGVPMSIFTTSLKAEADELMLREDRRLAVIFRCL